MTTITYRGIEYPARYVGNGALVSVESLNDAIQSDQEGGINDDAVLLDEDVSGYVPDEFINETDEDWFFDYCVGLEIITSDDE